MFSNFDYFAIYIPAALSWTISRLWECDAFATEPLE